MITVCMHCLMATPRARSGPGCGCSIEVEVWSLPDHFLADFVRTIAPPLGIGSIELMDGRWVHSFIAEPVATENAQEITRYGGWRKYKSDGSAGLPNIEESDYLQ